MKHMKVYRHQRKKKETDKNNDYIRNSNLYNNKKISSVHGYSDETQEEKSNINLSINGGTMKGDINMHSQKITGNPDLIFDDQLIREKYADDKFLEISQFRKELSETIILEYFKQHISSIYRFRKGKNNRELIYDPTTRKVSKLIDGGPDENDVIENTTNFQPLLCMKNERVKNKYFLKFVGTQRMISNINLNAISGKKDIINVFIVYKLKSFSSSNLWLRNGLFGNNNGGFDKSIAFGPNGGLVVSGDKNNFNVIGRNHVAHEYPTTGELNKQYWFNTDGNTPLNGDKHFLLYTNIN